MGREGTGVCVRVPVTGCWPHTRTRTRTADRRSCRRRQPRNDFFYSKLSVPPPIIFRTSYYRRLCTVIAILISTLSTPMHVSQRAFATTTIPWRLATASASLAEWVRSYDDDLRRTSSFVLWHAVVATMIPWQRATAAARARNGGWPHTYKPILLFNQNQSTYVPHINVSLILCFFICFFLTPFGVSLFHIFRVHFIEYVWI